MSSWTSSAHSSLGRGIRNASRTVRSLHPSSELWWFGTGAKSKVRTLICLTAAVAVGSLIAGAGCASVFSRSTGSPTGTFFVSPSGSDSSSCTSAAPCASFGRAYEVALPGDVVEVASGSYPAQVLSGTKAGGSCNGTGGGDVSGCVTFEPALGASVSVAGLEIGASFVRVEGISDSGGLQISDGKCSSGLPSDVVVQGVTGTNFFVDGGTNIAILGGSYGPVTNAQSSIQACGDYYKGTYSSNVLVQGVTFHDYHWVTDGVHMECLHVSSENGLVVRGSRFYNCGIFDMLLSNVNFTGPITIENNLFDGARGLNDATTGGSATLGVSPMSNLLIRNNSLLGGLTDEDYGRSGDTFTNTLFVGNAMSTPIDAFHCATYQQAGINVMYAVSATTGVACGQGSVLGDNLFVNPSVLDLRLNPGVAAIGHGDRLNYSGTDIGGNLRSPIAPDAGAWQVEDAAIIPGHSIGSVTLDMARSAVENVYGSPVSSSHTQLAGKKVDLFTYRHGGGRLSVVYGADTRVAAVLTSSAYYTMLSGVRVGVTAAAASAQLPRLRRTPGCKTVLNRQAGGAVTRLYLRGRTVAKVALLTGADAVGC
jgi:hypothetical protein